MKRGWAVAFVLLILECSKHPQALERCPNFVVEPPERVIIAPGGGRSVTCQYSDNPNPPPTVQVVVDWFKDSTTLEGTSQQATCFCTAGVERPLLNLTFMDFQNQGQGMYSCGAQVGPLNFDHCEFSLVVAVDPVVTLQQEHVSPNPANLGGTITISPVINNPGVPEATISWTHTPPLDPNRVNVSSPVLVIRDVVSSDRGVYTVTAASSEGSFVGGVVSRSVNVFVNFLELDGPHNMGINEGGDSIVLRCVAMGYPLGVSLEWSSSLGSMPGRIQTIQSTMNVFEKNITSTLSVATATCISGTVYTCRAMTGSGSVAVEDSFTLTDPICNRVTTGAPPPPPPPAEVSARAASFTQIDVMWTHGNGDSNSASRTGYRVRYMPRGRSDEQQEQDLPGGATTYSITGLMPGTIYEIEVGSLGSDDSNPSFAPPVSITTPCNVQVAEPMALISVEANLDQHNNQRTLNISWTHHPSDDAIAGFMVNVESLPSAGQNQMMMVSGTITSYLLPIAYCNGSMYNITVYAINQCGVAGPGTSVTQSCTVLNGNILTVEVTLTERNSLGLQLNLNNGVTPADVPSIYVNATTIENSAQGTISISVFRSLDYPASGFFCIGNLNENTYYNVCVTPVLSDSTHQQSACTQVLTASSGDGTLTNCAMADTVIETTRSTPAAEFPDWAIAVIVVGALALVALLFCIIGLCFACNTGDNKDDDLASISSLQASSIGPGSAGPYPNLRRNNMSPHRSCLSYHREGHSTNWNEHRDTLKQMETDVGTNV